MRKAETKKRTRPLSLKQLVAVAELLEGATMDAAARAVHVSRATIYRWRELPAFKAEFERGTRAAFDAALKKLKLSSRHAADKLAGLLESKDEGIRRLASKEVLLLAMRGIELEELETRLRALEDVVGNRETHPACACPASSPARVTRSEENDDEK